MTKQTRPTLEALRQMARQKLCSEVAPEEARAGDYEDGYEAMVKIARTALPIAEQEQKWMAMLQTALLRIYSVAEGLETGEENPVEAAQDIQRMALNGLHNMEVFRWSHIESDIAKKTVGVQG